MSLVKTTWNPNDRQLRQFGVVTLAALPLMAFLWGGGTQVIGIAAAVGAVVAVAGLFRPRLIKPVFLAVTAVAYPIGLLISELVLGLVFFVVFTPLALFFKLVGRDALQRTIDRQGATYWQPKKQASDAASYLRQW